MPTQLSADAEVPEIRVKTAYNGYVCMTIFILKKRMSNHNYEPRGNYYFTLYLYHEIKIMQNVIGYNATAV
jgi:hypothetical protein